MCELHRHARNERARPLFATSLSRAGTLSLTFPSYLLVLPSHLSSVRLYFPVSGLHHPSIASSGLQLVNLSRLSLPVFSLPLSLSLCSSCSFYHVIFLLIDFSLCDPLSYFPRSFRFFSAFLYKYFPLIYETSVLQLLFCLHQ